MAGQKKKRRGAAKKNRKGNKVTAPPVRKLTGLQKRTVDIYHSMGKPSKSQAYSLAGSDMTGKALEVEAQKVFAKPHVDRYLKKLEKAATERAAKKADAIIAELEAMGFSNVLDYLTFSKKGVTLKDSSTLTRSQAAAISKIKETFTKYGDAVTFELHEKKGSLELLARRHNLFPTRKEITGAGGQPIEVKCIMFGEQDADTGE